MNILAEARFPKPDFTLGYEYPDILHGAPNETFWNVLDIVLLVGMMALVVWAAYRKRSRSVIYAMSMVSVLYFGFFRSGCVCSVGSIQNVVTALVNPDYHLPWYVLLLFLQIQQDECQQCNECAIARVCPSDAIHRVTYEQAYQLKDHA